MCSQRSSRFVSSKDNSGQWLIDSKPTSSPRPHIKPSKKTPFIRIDSTRNSPWQTLKRSDSYSSPLNQSGDNFLGRNQEFAFETETNNSDLDSNVSFFTEPGSRVPKREAKLLREIKDLEITNTSLLQVNANLEDTLLLKNRKIRKLEHLLKTHSIDYNLDLVNVEAPGKELFDGIEFETCCEVVVPDVPSTELSSLDTEEDIYNRMCLLLQHLVKEGLSTLHHKVKRQDGKSHSQCKECTVFSSIPPYAKYCELQVKMSKLQKLFQNLLEAFFKLQQPSKELQNNADNNEEVKRFFTLITSLREALGVSTEELQGIDGFFEKSVFSSTDCHDEREEAEIVNIEQIFPIMNLTSHKSNTKVLADPMSEQQGSFEEMRVDSFSTKLGNFLSNYFIPHSKHSPQ